MATIQIITLRNVTGTADDGAALSGTVVDVARNVAKARVPASELMQAVDAFVDARLAAKDATVAQRDGRIIELQGTIEQKDARIAELLALIESAGGLPLHKQIARAMRRQAAQDAKSAAEAEIAAVDAEEQQPTP